MRQASIPGLVALVLGVVIATAVGLALVAARNSPDDPTWEYIGQRRDCSEVPLASELAFAAWEDQCRS